MKAGTCSQCRVNFPEQYKHFPVGKGRDTAGNTCALFGWDEAGMGLVEVVGAKKKKKKKGRATPSWVLSAAVDVEARMKEGDGQQAELHPPLPWLCMSVRPSEQQREKKAERWGSQQPALPWAGLNLNQNDADAQAGGAEAAQQLFLVKVKPQSVFVIQGWNLHSVIQLDLIILCRCPCYSVQVGLGSRKFSVHVA